MTHVSAFVAVAGIALSPALWSQAPSGGVCVPANQTAGIPETATEYARMCDSYYFCRSDGRENLGRGIVSVQMIGYHSDTGATCFFESPDGIGSLKQADYLEFDEAWIPPGNVQCVQCHLNDPFIHRPRAAADRSVQVGRLSAGREGAPGALW